MISVSKIPFSGQMLLWRWTRWFAKFLPRFKSTKRYALVEDCCHTSFTRITTAILMLKTAPAATRYCPVFASIAKGKRELSAVNVVMNVKNILAESVCIRLFASFVDRARRSFVNMPTLMTVQGCRRLDVYLIFHRSCSMCNVRACRSCSLSRVIICWNCLEWTCEECFRGAVCQNDDCNASFCENCSEKNLDICGRCEDCFCNQSVCLADHKCSGPSGSRDGPDRKEIESAKEGEVPAVEKNVVMI